MRRGKGFECEGITIGSGKVISKIDDDGYKYLWIIGRSDICQEQMKRSVKTEYFKRVRSALKSKLYAANMFQAINIWAVATAQYGAGIILQTKEELQQMDRKTRKLIAIYGDSTQDHVQTDSTYQEVMEKEVWQVLRTVEEEKCNLAKYVTQCKEALFKTAAAELNLEEYIVNVSNTKKKESRSKEWKQKALHGQFIRETDCENESKRWEWLRKGS